MKRLPVSRSPQPRTPIQRHGLLADAWQRASSRPAMQWYRALAFFVLATMAIKLVIMTATVLPGRPTSCPTSCCCYFCRFQPQHLAPIIVITIRRYPKHGLARSTAPTIP